MNGVKIYMMDENIDSTKIKHQLEVTLILNVHVVELFGKRQTWSLFPDYVTEPGLGWK